MTLIVDILGRAARQCSVPAPSSWITATERNALEVKDFLDETVSDILERVMIVSPVAATLSIVGTGLETYALPATVQRIQRGELAVFDELPARRVCTPVTNDGEWENLKLLGASGATRFYRLRGYPGALEIDFFPVLDVDRVVRVSVMQSGWVVRPIVAPGEISNTFMNDDDESVIPRRILEAGIVWRFRQRKGLEFNDKQVEYELLLGRYANESRNIRVVSMGPTRARSPFEVPVPDFIPGA